MTATASPARRQSSSQRVIKVSPAQVKAARLIVKRAAEGRGTASPAVRAMANARPAAK